MSRGSGRDNHSILSELEWDEGLSMPVANAENKALEDEVEIFQIAWVRAHFNFDWRWT